MVVGDCLRIGGYRHTVWSWTESTVPPNGKHMLALLALPEVWD